MIEHSHNSFQSYFSIIFIVFLFISPIHSQDLSLEWAASFGNLYEDRILSTTIDQSGNIYNTGYFQGTVNFDPNGGTTNLTSVGSEDIFVQKLDPNGNIIWAKSFGGGTFDFGTSIQVDQLGNIYVGGFYSDDVDFDPGAGVSVFTSNG